VTTVALFWFPDVSAVAPSRRTYVRLASVPMDVQGSLFGSGALEVRSEVPVHRLELDDGCWVDFAHGWLGGQMDLYEQLASSDVWRRGQRAMYGKMVDEPRLTTGMRVGGRGTPPVISQMAEVLAARYGVSMRGLWLNWYRNGDEAVAWHSDRIGRAVKDPPVAIVSLGSARRFLLRPKGGGRSAVFTPAGGDLLVMGGACQHRWEHSVPRSKRGGPRISVTFRPRAPDRGR
jgi:alkylated DNA repair dioxygenase AlkB